jgi:hypothetical protein
MGRSKPLRRSRHRLALFFIDRMAEGLIITKSYRPSDGSG